MFTSSDLIPGSGITARLANGMTVQTAYSATPFLWLNSYSLENNGSYQRQMDFSSHQNIVQNDGGEGIWAMVDSLGLSFDENFTQAPLAIKANWSTSLANYNSAEFYLMIDGQEIIAEIITLSTNQDQTDPEPEPVPEVSLSVALISNAIPADGGDLQITRSTINMTELVFEVEQWHYISMPDGTQYPISLPAGTQLVALENKQNVTVFSIPSYWPAGSYTYHVATIIVDNGYIDQSSVSFVKLN